MAYRALNDYLRERFGKKIYKISLSMPFTCPNRDGTKGVGGCLFCSGEGSGNFAASAYLPVAEQLAQGKEKVRQKLPKKDYGYIAYFQAFSSTYGPLAVMREKFTQAIEDPEVVALSVATRPDCLPEEVLDLLEELNRRKPVWVELGLQTANEKTAKLIRRGYKNEVFTQGVTALHQRGIEVIVHLIVGLPEENHEDEINSILFAGSHPIAGIKLHLLHVLKGTDLAQMDYRALSLEEYVERVTDLLRYIPPHVVIHRLTGDGDKRELLAPLWSGDKKRVLNAIHQKIREETLVQGEKLLLP